MSAAELPDGAWDAWLTQYLTTKPTTNADSIPVAIRVMTMTMLVRAFDDDELASLITESGRQHAIMPVIDPTAYRSSMAQLQVLEAAARGIRAVRSRLSKIVR